MKRKFTAFLGLFLAVAVTCCACSQAPSTESASSGVDDTAKVQTRTDLTPQSDVQATPVRVEPCFGVTCDTFSDLNRYATEIVRCTTESVGFILCGNEPYTLLNVRVEDSLKGSHAAGDRITVVQYGGYMTLQEEVEYSGDASRYPSLTKAEREKLVLEKKYTDEPYPKAGDRFVFFLSESRLVEGAYVPLCDAYGRYKLDADGSYVRAVSGLSEAGEACNRITYDAAFTEKIRTLAQTEPTDTTALNAPVTSDAKK